MNLRTNVLALSLLIVIAVFGFAEGQQEAAGQAEEVAYPNKEVTLILGVSPGGSMETTARQFQPFLEEELGQPVVIETIPGAGGIIANTIVQRSDPDGYTFTMMPLSFLVTQTMLFDAPYGFDDFEVVTNFHTGPQVLRVHNDAPWDTLMDLIEDARSRPGEIVFSDTSLTTASVLPLLEMEEKMGVDFELVPFGGGGPGRLALAGGHVDANISGAYASLHIADETRVLGVFQDENLWTDITDDAPPVSEALGTYITPNADRISLFAPAGLQEQYPDRFRFFYEAFERALTNETYLDVLRDVGQEGKIIVRTPEESQELLMQVHEQYESRLDFFEEYVLEE